MDGDQFLSKKRCSGSIFASLPLKIRYCTHIKTEARASLFCYSFTMKQALQRKIRVAVLFGGKSAEHEISVRSAQNVVRALDKQRYDVTLVGIDKNGSWNFCEISQLFSDEMKIFCKQSTSSNAISQPFNAGGKFLGGKGSEEIDVVFPVLHGPFGEDGTIQGLLKLAHVPFVGASVLGSAVGMDKDITKRLLRDAGIPLARFLTYKNHERKNITFEKLKQSLGVPFFVKPANLGSSVGITKVHNKQEYSAALELAFLYDTKILIEEYINGKEVECAVLGNEAPIASLCGEITPHHEFYSYEAKYLDENGVALSIPAHIPKRVSKKIQKLAIQVFEVLCCEGMARVDFFVTDSKNIFINEINTIPGFTSISMYPKLWEASGISYAKLIDTLIEFAIKRFHGEQKLQTAFIQK